MEAVVASVGVAEGQEEVEDPVGVGRARAEEAAEEVAVEGPLPEVLAHRLSRRLQEV